MGGFVPAPRPHAPPSLSPAIVTFLLPSLSHQLNTSSSTNSLMVLGVLFSIQNNVFNITTTSADNGSLPINLAQSSGFRGSMVEISSTSTEESYGFTGDELNGFTGATTIFSPSSYSLASNGTEGRNHFLPVFELVLGAVTYLVIIAMTVIGNSLVIAAVFTYRPLKKVQNYFLVSLAASDMAVAIIVMPLHVVKFLADGHWLLGVTVCQLFTTADILLCTSSILNLCAIALDRYWAIHNPIDYAQKRTPRFVCTAIALVWLVSVCISVPPLIGWNDWSSKSLMDHCELTTDKAFVIYSASGSFFVPLVIMIIVYLKIFLSARQRIRTNRGRSALVRINQAAANDSSHTQASKIPIGGHPCFSLSPTTKTTTVSMLSPPRAASLVVNSGHATATHQKAGKPKTKRSSSHSSSISTLSLNPFNRMSKRNANAVTRNNSDSGVAVQLAAARLFLKDNGEREPKDGWHDGQIDLDGPTTVVDDSQMKHSLPNNGTAELILSEEKTNTTTKSSSSDDTTRNCSGLAGMVETTMVAMPTPAKAKTQFKVDEVAKPAVSNGPCGPQEQLTTSVLKNREKISVAKEKRAAKTIAVIIFVFTFCWLPFFCAYVILPFCESCSLHPKVHQAFVWLGYINSSLNPFLYGILNLEFRRAFRKILCPKAFLNSQKRRSLGGRGKK